MVSLLGVKILIRFPDLGLTEHRTFPSYWTVANSGFQTLYSCGTVPDFHRVSLFQNG